MMRNEARATRLSACWLILDTQAELVPGCGHLPRGDKSSGGRLSRTGFGNFLFRSGPTMPIASTTPYPN